MSLTTRKMSDRHEEDLVALLGGEKTRNSGAVWSDQADGHQTGLDQYWLFTWDGKSTLGKSIGISRAMLAKLREQSRGLEILLPLRWYANDRLTEVDEDWIAVEAETFAQVLEDANAYRALLAEDRHKIAFDDEGWLLHHPTGELLKKSECPAKNSIRFEGETHTEEGLFYCSVLDEEGDGNAVVTIEERVDA